MSENHCITCCAQGYEVSLFKDGDVGHSSVCSLCEVQLSVDVARTFISVYCFFTLYCVYL
jgi:hypothetical protein